MKIIIRNNAQHPKKMIRLIKWKLFRIQEKFKQLIYVEVFLNAEGNTPKTYIANIRLGIPGNDIIIQNKSQNLGKIYQKSIKNINRLLAKNKVSKSR